MKFPCVLAFFVTLFQNGLTHPCKGPETNSSEPLFLTPLIRNGEIERAKMLSWVEPFPRFDHSSYSGFITIDDHHDSNMFFWYFLAENNSKNAPVLLWMTGGPGITSLNALFGETGPFYVDPNQNLRSRDINWVSQFNVIYLDVPVGGGFSFTNDTSGYATSNPQVASQVAGFLDQFFTMFVEYKNNDFYIVGKSYSGRVAVGLAQELLSRDGQLPANLAGVVTLCGYFDVVSLNVKSDNFYYLGLLNEKQRKFVADQEAVMVDSVLNGSVSQSGEAVSNITRSLTEITGMVEFSNALLTELPTVFSDYEPFIDQTYVRQKLHVGDRVFNGPENVTKAITDKLVSSKPYLDYILSKSDLKVLLISAQFDLHTAPNAHHKFVTSLNWPGSASFDAAPRRIYKVDANDQEVAGYVQQAGQLTEIMLRSAGHMIAHDQPRAMLDLMNRFTRNLTFI